MNPEWHLRIAGALQIALAILHVFFPRRFNWKEELGRLSLLNRQIFLVHTIYIALVLMLIGALSLIAPRALLDPTPLARFVLAGFTLFWGLRLVFQWVVYDRSLWRGNRFNTLMHWLFTALWMYLSFVYALAWAAVNGPR
jgi:hypothetical protein